MDIFLEYVNKFVDFISSEKRFSCNTVKAYSDDLFQFYDFCKQNNITTFESISIESIRNWVLHLNKLGNLSRSINRKIVTLRSFYEFLVNKSIVYDNIVNHIRLLKTDKKLPKFISVDEVDNVLSDDCFDDSFEGIRNRFIIEVLYDTGIRLSELLSLVDDDVDLDNRVIKVMGKRSKERIIPFPDLFVEQYVLYIKKRNEIISNPCRLIVRRDNKPCYPMMIQRLTKKVLAMNTRLVNGSPHVLRHTYATHLLNNGANLQVIKDLLGHSSLASTQVYTHNNIQQLKDVYLKCHPHS